MITPADLAFLENIKKDPSEERFMYLVQEEWNLSPDLLLALLNDKEREILPFRVTAQHLSWCPSITREIVHLKAKKQWDMAGLSTMPWATREWMALNRDRKKWNWDRMTALAHTPVADLIQMSRAGEVPRRAVSARADLSRELVLENMDFPWIRSIMNIDAISALIGGA